ncbi:MAG: hypothetical protein K8R23_06700 [Chthoniobacter sp.]|nr:hypothetical protein [Chthoniobacter sp.]
MNPKPPALQREEWDFTKVPNSELAGCCWWEYARESAFIRDVRQRCLESRRTDAPNDEQLHQDVQKLQSIGDASEVFLRGCFLEPGIIYQSISEKLPHFRHPESHPITGSFPAPWQSLSSGERACRALVASYGKGIAPKPIERTHGHEAEDIAKSYRSRWHEVITAFHKIQKENPGKSEVQLRAEGKLEPYEEIWPSLFWESGCETTVLRIAWARYTNDELVQAFRKWVKKHRPKEIPVPSNKGRKPGDVRTHLTRLAVVRLLSRFRISQILNPKLEETAAILNSAQFSGNKWLDSTKWHDARREAGRLFRELFPFLSTEEKPLSWERPTPRK